MFTLKSFFMKIIFVTALISFFVLQLSGQIMIRNTEWKGQIMRQGNSREVSMDFNNDTFYVYRNAELISTFAFFQSHDTLTLTKTGGSGPCPMTSKGVYRIELVENGEKFFFRLISEECPGRATGWTSSPFERIH
jgi:hypothetical protein